MMSTVRKGNKLEDDFYEYLVDQKRQGVLVYGAHPSHLCEIHKKKKYFSKDREDEVEFDIVVELFREERSTPYLYLVFECKNHEGAIQDRDVRDFSDKLSEIFPHACKGVVVVSSRLQKGAESLARSRKLGIVKFDVSGVDVVLDRKGGTIFERRAIAAQIYQDETASKSLKFSALLDGSYYGSISKLFGAIISETVGEGTLSAEDKNAEEALTSSRFPYVSDMEIQSSAHELLTRVGYRDGPVDLECICRNLGLSLSRMDEDRIDSDGWPILGTANFVTRKIEVSGHENGQRERFTIAHEIGHFFLCHDRYLLSEPIIEQDFRKLSQSSDFSNYDRLECQANIFASSLLLPLDVFVRKVAELRLRHDIKSRGHGYIFVDDQPWNYTPYRLFLLDVSSYFEVSMQAIEIKLNRMGMLTDQRHGR